MRSSKSGFTLTPEFRKFGVTRLRRGGFTLIELLVTIAIIGILSTLAVTAVQVARSKARVAKARQDLDQLTTAIKFMENDVGYWPGHQPVDKMCRDLPGGCPGNNELCADGCANSLSSGPGGLTQDDTGDPYPSWGGPYIATIPTDPWGNEYFFDTDYDHAIYGWSVIIGSYGPNGTGYNDYDADDIVKIIYR